MKRVLTIAGSDCSGGAGIQADLKTITAFGMYGMSVITALTAQNTRGVFDVRETDERMLRGQFEAVCSDLPPDAVKIGMLPSETAVLAVADALEKWKPRHVVCDPVMVSTSGRTLMSPQAEAAARELLYPRVSLITPNMSEAKRLLAREFPDMDGNIPPGFKSSPEEECRRSRAELGSKAGPENEEEPENKAIQEDAARILGDRLKTSVLVKGGHVTGGADDCLYHNGRLVWFRSERLPAKWDRVYALFGDCLRARGRMAAGGCGGICQGISFRGFADRAGIWTWKRAFKPLLRNPGSVSPEKESRQSLA